MGEFKLDQQAAGPKYTQFAGLFAVFLVITPVFIGQTNFGIHEMVGKMQISVVNQHLDYQI